MNWANPGGIKIRIGPDQLYSDARKVKKSQNHWTKIPKFDPGIWIGKRSQDPGMLIGHPRVTHGATHAKFTIENVHETSKDNDEVEGIPRITKVVLVIPKDC